MSEPFVKSEEILRAFEEYDRKVILNNISIGCLIGIVLMPLGTVLDYFVYYNQVFPFFKLRLLCSFLIGLFWIVVKSSQGQRHPREFGMLLAFFPAFFISWMIYKTAGAHSSYYAGLNLVLLVVGFVLHWTFIESLIVVSVVLAMYVAACVFHGEIFKVDLLTHLYFLILTGVIVAAGSYFHSKTRFREFAFQYELNQSKQKLEASNLKLADQNAALEQANRDIMEAEAQLVQSEKMASLGLLAAKVAHEIRNPLHYSRMNLDTLRKRCKQLPPDQHAEAGAIFADMDDGISRIDNIVSDLLTFAQPGGQEPEPVDVAHIFKTTLRYVANQLQEKNVRLEQNLAPGHVIRVNRQQFNQVLVNLIENSIDAFAAKPFSGGEAPLIKISCRTENGHCRLSIRDNGMGIEPQNLAKIFDPFFTTKDIGKGTGLGLSICFGIIRGFGGTLTVESEPGKFCEFTIDLPAVKPASNDHGNR